MDRKNVKGWFVQLDFMIVDLFCLELSYLTAVLMGNGLSNPWENPAYRDMSVVFLLADILLMSGHGIFANVLKRGAYDEWIVMVKHACLVILMGTFFLYITQKGAGYSRVVIAQTGVQYLLLGYAGRVAWKRHLLAREGIQDQMKEVS